MSTSLSLKIIGAIVLAVLFVVPVVAYHNISKTRKVLEKNHLEKAITTARLLDASIHSLSDLQDKDHLFEKIQRHLWLEPDSLSIDINLMSRSGLSVVVSSDGHLIGRPADEMNLKAFQNDQIITNIEHDDDIKWLRVVTPIHIAQSVHGTFKLDISMDTVEQQVNNSISSLLKGYIAIIAVFIVFGYLLIHRIVLAPIKSLNKGIQAMSRGEWDYCVRAHSNDEIGRVTDSFNYTRHELFRSKKQIEDNMKEQVTLNQQLSASNQKLIAAYKKTEEIENNYSKLFNLTRDGYAISRGFSDWINANPAFLTMLGYRLDELLALSPDDLSPLNWYDQNKAEVTAQLMTHGFTELTETEYIHKDGRVFPVQLQSFLLNKSNNFNDSLVASFVRDITQIKETETALRRSQKMDAIGQLTGGIAHDFNNILGIILGNVSLLEIQTQGDPQIAARVEAIGKSARRAGELTRQLLEFSRQQADQVVITDIGRLIYAMEDLIASSVTPEVEVKVQLERELGLVNINAGEFEDSLLNLVLNARDAMPNGGRLTIHARNRHLDARFCSAHPTITPGEFIQVTISDTGIGISPAQHNQIFDPFFTTKPQGQGTGLGLSMVFGFVKRSGGIIQVESDVGKGCSFHIFLPAEETPDLPQQTAFSNVETLDTWQCKHETILVVDDEVELLELVREVLERAGYNVLVASDSQKALSYLTSEPAIALLFSDLVMPGAIDGYQLAEKAQKINPNVKVLLTSGYNKKTRTAEKHPFIRGNLIKKPYSLAKVLNQIQIELRN